jgi:hypothetical protein
MRLKDGIDDKIGNIRSIDRDTIITPFFTSDYCDFLVGKFNDVGWDVDGDGNFDTYLHKIKNGKKDCKDYLSIVQEKIEPIIVENWTHVIKNRLWKYYPVPFAKKFSKDGQYKLNMHVDNSLLTLFIKLNDNFGGCETVFPRQNWDSSDLRKGEMLIMPGVVTHPHYTKPIIYGEKYSLVGRISILDVRESNYFSDNIEDIIKDNKDEL